jgi:hypothetical protein
MLRRMAGGAASGCLKILRPILFYCLSVYVPREADERWARPSDLILVPMAPSRFDSGTNAQAELLDSG